MMDTKMARFRVETSQETGEVMLLIETQCGFRPVMGWPDIGSFKEFKEMLVGICVRINKKNNGVREVSDKLLKQALGDDLESEQ
jgi:hypothetical protein